MKSFTTTQDMAQYEVSQDYCEPYLGATHDDLQAARFNKYNTHIDKNEFFIYDDVNHKYNIYRRVEYIENISNAYIDTGFKNGAYAWSVDAVISFNTIKQGYIIGSRGSSSTRYFQMFRLNSTGNFFTTVYDTSEYNNDYIIELNKKYHFDGSIKLMNITYNDIDEETNEIVEKSFTIVNNGDYYNNGYTINIFNWVGQDHVNHRTQGKIYYCKIYNGNTLVRDFIPVKNTLTNQYGLLDTVEQKFYVSPNGVEFNGGNEIIEDKNGIQYYVKNYVNVNDTKYISIGIYPDAQDSWEADFYFNGTGRNYAWGSWSGGGTALDNSYGINTYNGQLLYQYDNQEFAYNCVYGNKRMILKANKNVFYKDGQKVGELTEKTGNQASRVMYVGNFNGSSYAGNGKLYSFKYWRHDELVRDYIPVQRISDSVYGLYDKVNGTFKISAGSAQFTGG